jgi:hypothetical protein
MAYSTTFISLWLRFTKKLERFARECHHDPNVAQSPLMTSPVRAVMTRRDGAAAATGDLELWLEGSVRVGEVDKACSRLLAMCFSKAPVVMLAEYAAGESWLIRVGL